MANKPQILTTTVAIQSPTIRTPSQPKSAWPQAEITLSTSRAAT